MSGRNEPVTWNGRTVQAWVPDALRTRNRDISERTRRATETALASLVQVDAALPVGWESFARILLRAEGIASSSVEGITAPATAVLAAIHDSTTDHDAAWIADNLAVVTDSLADTIAPLNHARLCAWHARLMQHGRLPPELVGAYRDSLGWIGGTSPTTAVYVAPPPEQLHVLMDDLLEYVNADTDDPVTQAAVAHGQFETIHPFGDGNGRIGRVLIAWVLARRAGLTHLPPPVSVLIARDPGGYISGLYNFREGSLDSWVQWFAGVVQRSTVATAETLDELNTVVDRWAAATATLRADSAARALLAVLVDMPVLTATLAAERLGVSMRSARDGLRQLEQRGIVEPIKPPTAPAVGRSPQWWAATEVTATIGSWAS